MAKIGKHRPRLAHLGPAQGRQSNTGATLQFAKFETCSGKFRVTCCSRDPALQGGRHRMMRPQRAPPNAATSARRNLGTARSPKASCTRSRLGTQRPRQQGADYPHNPNQNARAPLGRTLQQLNGARTHIPTSCPGSAPLKSGETHTVSHCPPDSRPSMAAQDLETPRTG